MLHHLQGTSILFLLFVSVQTQQQQFVQPDYQWNEENYGSQQSANGFTVPEPQFMQVGEPQYGQPFFDTPFGQPPMDNSPLEPAFASYPSNGFSNQMDTGFLCSSSGLLIPSAAVCDQYPDCPNGEDESVCDVGNSNGESVQSNEIPKGFVKLPDDLQQKSYLPQYPIDYPAPDYSDGFSNGQQQYGNLPPYPEQFTIYPPPLYPMNNEFQEPNFPMQPFPPMDNTFDEPAQFNPDTPSQCANPPPSTPCPIPWIRGSRGFYYDPIAMNCLPFIYSGCAQGDNHFQSYEDCMQSCIANKQCGNSGFCNNQQSTSQQQPFWCSNGMQLPGQFVCNGNLDCPYGEDEANCNGGAFNDDTPIVELTLDSFQSAIAASENIVVDFYAPWCPACSEFDPEYKIAARKSASLGLPVTFAKVNVETQRFLADQFGIDSYPTVFLWRRNAYNAAPVQYYKPYGLSSDRLLQWISDKLSSVFTEYPNMCGIGQLHCGDGMCVSAQQVCDRIWNCRNGGDEEYCLAEAETTTPAPTTSEKPTYGTTTTVRPDYATTSPPDYTSTDRPNYNVSDECAFRCSDGTCQPRSARCDGQRDCSDGLDESNCGSSCQRTEHTCYSDGECIDYFKRCDGVWDCEDGSDEYLCEDSNCSRTEFICSDSTCVSFAYRCDGSFDCPDRSDEIMCPERCNDTTQFTCNNGRCIDIELRCDGEPDCHDFTDEISCGPEDYVPGECNPNFEWECADRRRCIDVRRRCDGYPDCADLSDEDITVCPTVDCNESWQFQCSDKKRCIDRRRQCDGYHDCYDKSDETDCLNVTCQYWQFKCTVSGVCIDERRACDGVADCLDGSDEEGCEGTDEMTTEDVYPDSERYDETTTASTVGTTEEDIIVDYGNYGGFGIVDYDASGEAALEEEFECPTICPAVYDPVCGSDGATYSNECSLVRSACANQNAALVVIAPGECPKDPEEPCENHQWRCSDGKCIELLEVCDGVDNCAEGEDEMYCDEEASLNVTEPTSDFICPDGQALAEFEICDGFPNCADGEDEADCPGDSGLIESLQEVKGTCDELDEFACKTLDCIPIYLRCNGEEDCMDGSDEFDCSLQTDSDYSGFEEEEEDETANYEATIYDDDTDGKWWK